MYFDTHAHYDSPAFDADRDAVLASLPGKGIGLVLNAGAGEESSRASLGLADKYDFVYASVGIHPEEAASVSEGWRERLAGLAAHEKCRAIGEIGLDYHYPLPTRDIQKRIFDEQLCIARELGLPVIIHQREAFSDTLDILRAHTGIRGVFHCFSGNRETAKIVLDMGFYISLGGAVTFKNAKKPPEVMAFIPWDRLLLETDSPYMTPHPFRGRRNDSSYLPFIAQAAAALRGSTLDEVADITLQNGRELFSI